MRPSPRGTIKLRNSINLRMSTAYGSARPLLLHNSGLDEMTTTKELIGPLVLK